MPLGLEEVAVRIPTRKTHKRRFYATLGLRDYQIIVTCSERSPVTKPGSDVRPKDERFSAPAHNKHSYLVFAWARRTHHYARQFRSLRDSLIF